MKSAILFIVCFFILLAFIASTVIFCINAKYWNASYLNTLQQQRARNWAVLCFTLSLFLFLFFILTLSSGYAQEHIKPKLGKNDLN
jgi:uncharacterized membrane protein YbhN (UPF0104 family)